MRSSALRAAAAVLALAAMPLSAIPAGAASASYSAQVVATINIAIRSVSVSVSSLVYGSCTDPNSNPTGAALVVPSGSCITPAYTVTNGAAPGHIFASGSDAVPTDQGVHWTLCVNTSSRPTCVNPPQNALNLPGQDQFLEHTNPVLPAGQFLRVPIPDLTNAPACDLAFNLVASGGQSCTAIPNQSVGETLAIQGPVASTDSSTSFTTSITWTAVP